MNHFSTIESLERHRLHQNNPMSAKRNSYERKGRDRYMLAKPSKIKASPKPKEVTRANTYHLFWFYVDSSDSDYVIRTWAFFAFAHFELDSLAVI